MGVLGYCMNIKVLNITKDLDIYIIFTRYLQSLSSSRNLPEDFSSREDDRKQPQCDGDVYSYFRNEEAQHYKFIKSFIKHAFIKSY